MLYYYLFREVPRDTFSNNIFQKSWIGVYTINAKIVIVFMIICHGTDNYSCHLSKDTNHNVFNVCHRVLRYFDTSWRKYNRHHIMIYIARFPSIQSKIQAPLSVTTIPIKT